MDTKAVEQEFRKMATSLGLEPESHRSAIIRALEKFLSWARDVPAEARELMMTQASAAGGRSDDRIMAHRERFDQSRMGEYQQVDRYAREHECSFEEALAACRSG